ncbi:MAG: hypothetical protein AB3N10_15425, partial [Allomuricauda sp.]
MQVIFFAMPFIASTGCKPKTIQQDTSVAVTQEKVEKTHEAVQKDLQNNEIAYLASGCLLHVQAIYESL